MTADNIPVGYVRPEFPSLFWPLGATSQSYHSSYLYYTKDIWAFTVIWTVILFSGFYGAAGAILCFNNSRRSVSVGLSYILGYALVGGAQGFCTGSVCGVM